MWRRPVATLTRRHFVSFARQEVETVVRQEPQIRSDKRRRHWHHWTRMIPKRQIHDYSIVCVQEDCDFLFFYFVLSGAVFPWQSRPHEVSFCVCAWGGALCTYVQDKCVDCTYILGIPSQNFLSVCSFEHIDVNAVARCVISARRIFSMTNIAHAST